MHRNPGAFIAPALDEPMHAVVSAVISAPRSSSKQPLGRTALPLRQLGFLLKNLRQNLDPVTKLRRRLNARAYLNSVLWLRMTLRTVARDTESVRTIS